MTTTNKLDGAMTMTDDDILHKVAAVLGNPLLFEDLKQDFTVHTEAADWLKFARALLSASKPAAPLGWKLVPFEPTQEMHDAGRAALTSGTVPMEKVFRAMLAASPPAPDHIGDATDMVAAATQSESAPLGSDFDDFLREEGIYEEVTEKAKDKIECLHLHSDLGRAREPRYPEITGLEIGAPGNDPYSNLAAAAEAALNLIEQCIEGDGDATDEGDMLRSALRLSAPDADATQIERSLTGDQRDAITTAISGLTTLGWTHCVPLLRAMLGTSRPPQTEPQTSVGWFVRRTEFGPWIEVEQQELGAEQLYRAAQPADGSSN